MQSDQWIEKGDFRSKTKSCILAQSEKCLFQSIFFDRAIRSAHPVENIFEAGPHLSPPQKHTITPYNNSDAGLTAAAAAAAAAHSESAWHILFSARQQLVPSSDGSSACYR